MKCSPSNLAVTLNAWKRSRLAVQRHLRDFRRGPAFAKHAFAVEEAPPTFNPERVDSRETRPVRCSSLDSASQSAGDLVTPASGTYFYPAVTLGPTTVRSGIRRLCYRGKVIA
jgi:hypothetical protein